MECRGESRLLLHKEIELENPNWCQMVLRMLSTQMVFCAQCENATDHTHRAC